MKKIILFLIVIATAFWLVNRWGDKRMVEGYCTAHFNHREEIGRWGIFDRIGCDNMGCGWNTKGKMKCDFWKIK